MVVVAAALQHIVVFAVAIVTVDHIASFLGPGKSSRPLVPGVAGVRREYPDFWYLMIICAI